MGTPVRFPLVLALPAALCFGLAGACTDGTTPDCSDADVCGRVFGDGGELPDTGGPDTGQGQDSGGPEADSATGEAGLDAARDTGAETGADAGKADGDAGPLKDARGQ